MVAAVVGHTETNTRQLLDFLMRTFTGERYHHKIGVVDPELETRYEKHAVSHIVTGLLVAA